MSLIEPTLRNLLDQHTDVAEIRLNISRQYRRFEFDVDAMPQFPEGITVVLGDEDYGPATKVLPTVKAFAGEDVEILFCDDDQHYEPNWAQQFLDARRNAPNACIAEMGFDLYDRRQVQPPEGIESKSPRARQRRKTLGYRLFRAATLGRLRPSPYDQGGYLDGFKGFRGAMIRPDFVPEAAFDIPDVMWTHDDYWLSGQMAAHGVPVWVFASEKPWRLPHGAERVNALLNWQYKGHDRDDVSALVLKHFQENYGLWMDGES